MLEAAQYFDWDNVATSLKDGVGFSRTLLSEVERYQAGEGSNDKPLKVRTPQVDSQQPLSQRSRYASSSIKLENSRSTACLCRVYH